MTDLLLVEKVAEAIANFALSRMNVRELDWNEMGEERRPYFRDAATAAIAAMPGYEAGLVEGFKQGIEAAAKVVDQRRDLILNSLSAAAAMAVVDAMPDAIRALADDGKEGAG